MKGIIYQICANQEQEIYIGASVHTKEQALKEHKAHYKAFLNGRGKYISSFDLLRYPNVNTNIVINVIEDLDSSDYENMQVFTKELAKRKFDIMCDMFRNNERIVNRVMKNDDFDYTDYH